MVKAKRVRRVIVSLAQIKYFSDNSRHNFAKIQKYIKLAAKRNADIVCFPESCIHKSALELDHWIIDGIKEECKKNEIWAIVTDDFNKGERTYNTSLLINRKGEIVGGYKKIHLYGDKTDAGRTFNVFKTDFAKIGIAICWDLAFPDLFKKMKDAGAEIVFCPAQWWYDAKTYSKYRYGDARKKEAEILKSLIRARAFENVFFVALVNPVLDSNFQVSYTGIASPTRVLKEITGKEGLITVKINLNEIKKVEKVINS
jgi:predicted amidohydrolase